MPKTPARERKVSLVPEEELELVMLLKLLADREHPMEVRDLIDAVSYLVMKMIPEQKEKLPFKSWQA